MLPLRRSRLVVASLATLVPVLTFTVAAQLAACGSRTGLLGGDVVFLDDEDASAGDAAVDARARDVDASRDASRDAARDAVVDALPPLTDAPVPPPDVIDRTNCPDAAATLVYVISTNNTLLSYDPATSQFRSIGPIACPGVPAGSTPFSMAVDRVGTAYVLFNHGGLYRVSTRTAVCSATPFEPSQNGIQTFGMGYAAEGFGGREQLFIASDTSTTTTRGLAVVDDQFRVNLVAPFDPDIERAELTGTGDGRLFAFYTRPELASSAIGLIEKTTGRVLAESVMTGVDQGNGWAFAFWGGDFYMFTAPGAQESTDVTRFRPSDGSITRVANYTGGGRIVGAGVSTCAPAQ